MKNYNNIDSIIPLLSRCLFVEIAGRDGYLLQGHRDGLHQVQQDQPGKHLRVSTFSYRVSQKMKTLDIINSVLAESKKKADFNFRCPALGK